MMKLMKDQDKYNAYTCRHTGKRILCGRTFYSVMRETSTGRLMRTAALSKVEGERLLTAGEAELVPFRPAGA